MLVLNEVEAIALVDSLSLLATDADLLADALSSKYSL